MKRFMALFYALLAICILSATATAAGANFYVAFGTITTFTLMASTPQGALFAGLNQEIWTDVMVEQFRNTEDALFLNEIPDESRWVQASRNGNNEFIHLTDIGVDPDVLINNTTYPIPYQAQMDADISLKLDKFQTKVTPVTDDEIQHLAYDKIKKVQEKHTKAIMNVKHQKALHALCPAADTATTPIIVTTGPDDGAGRKRMIYKDLLTLVTAMNNAGIGMESRVLVLSAEHHTDLILEGLETNNNEKAKLANVRAGKLENFILGMQPYWYVNAPWVVKSTKVKKAFGAVPAGTDSQASVVFVADDMFKAMGSTKQYTKQPEPSTQQWEYNVRHHYLVMPRKVRAVAAIING